MSHSKSPALACLNVEKTFVVRKEINALELLLGRPYHGPSVRALHEITFAVPRGEILGVLGRNGAGKSTLLRVLAGVYPSTKGKVTINGQAQGLFEMGGMGGRLHTGREYAKRYLQLMGVPSADLGLMLKDINEFAELGDAFDRPIRTYSSGMQSRLYFAVATALKHEIYLVDELLSVGDEHFQSKCWLRIRERLAGGASGVLVTHDWTAILKLCRLAVILDEGVVKFCGLSDQAVVQYLDKPVPDGAIASLMAETPTVQFGKTTSATEIRAWVEIKEPRPVAIAISIEVLRIGVGWEIIVLTEPVELKQPPGKYRVDFTIENPLFVPGEYSLNLFITCEGFTCDAKGWTYGNGCTLIVEGTPSAAAANLPFEVEGDIVL